MTREGDVAQHKMSRRFSSARHVLPPEEDGADPPNPTSGDIKSVRLNLALRHRGGFRQFDVYIHVVVFAANIKVTGGKE